MNHTPVCCVDQLAQACPQTSEVKNWHKWFQSNNIFDSPTQIYVRIIFVLCLLLTASRTIQSLMRYRTKPGFTRVVEVSAQSDVEVHHLSCQKSLLPNKPHMLQKDLYQHVTYPFFRYRQFIVYKSARIVGPVNFFCS